MKKILFFILLFTFFLLLFSPFYTSVANAGQAGVGVLNLPPKYSELRLIKHEDTIRLYITVSDYNSWADIFSISVVLEEDDAEKAVFVYQQFDEKDPAASELNEFSETPASNNLLLDERCSYSHSDSSEDVTDKCNLDILFVFQMTSFSRIKIIAETSNLEIDYSSEDLVRSGSIIVFPGINEPITVEVHPYLLDISALIVGICGTLYIFKKTDLLNVMRLIYEKG